MDTSRDVVMAALNHRQPSRVPVDFGATAVTGMHCSCVAALRDHFRLEKRPVKVHEPFQMLGLIESDLQEALGVDVLCPTPRGTLFGFRNENWRAWRAPWGQELLVSEHFRTKPADDGGLLIFPIGDTDAPASGHMPQGGYFFDAIVRQEPIDEDKLDPENNLEEFAPVSDAWLSEFAADCREARTSGKAVVSALPGTALGDIALVPAPFMKHPKGIRDIAEWYMSTAARQDYVHAIFEKQTQIALANMGRIADACADSIDIVFLCGTDFGTQTSTFCSPATYAELWQPYYRQMTSWIHAHTPWKIFKHSCGAVEKLIPSFIQSGFDILNPVQCSAAGMDAQRLKDLYGQQIVFWGGGIDTQHVLPFGTPQEVRQMTLERCRIFSPGGGFVFNAVHNVQAGTPVANMVSMFDALREINV